ncbi:hypothetical protein [Teredinibacter sp. KSP-S5-2]|uniref:hypothetical protein n=1 Tax=Teredinibacter sp. KSP-S5-2 TaxID=3034506 RepID=UPI0029350B52|nr:hypothetical protein [Teredinibacter sp. KSP-S5-2]WNO10211.1 hypothetical protein P5V12_03395 [Teredinibacter sp. KSP-S5-2]
MTVKKCIVSVVLVFAFAIMWNGLFHMVLISEQNALIADLRRSDMSEKMLLSLLITLGMAILFVISYNKWLSKGDVIESLTHGLFFAVLAGVLVNANQYFIYPIPGKLACLWFMGGLIEFCFYALIVWLVQRYD